MHGGVGAQVSDQVVNQLLTNIDGVEALNNIVVIGMTNRKDLLDEAILRPGRFEVHIEVHLPNAAGREQILRIHTKDLAKNNLLGADIKIEELARLTKNFTGAEIEALVKCASSHSISRTTNILEFGKELVIDERALKVERQDFLKAL
jgi:vesicle-fusing ATPase